MNRIVNTEYAMFVTNKESGDEFLCAGPFETSIAVKRAYEKKLKDEDFKKMIVPETAHVCTREIVISQGLWEPYDDHVASDTELILGVKASTLPGKGGGLFE
ncbi:hypothetical protein bpr_II387 (plasmid) [Butyrivibrio proteoclasticus B316]|uniref:Uncharacterized protein n=1 Tax=Butyrivibrio proteoclasticus (strain ATCC 51982 / DSM 14932 / B316) TaxID=515622 RepID=E0S4J2_BUTPB|nr:hypothetical protein [Butyrivibrio proteoclasticus]ADL36324.1 hypothetical protein bpr_II387 [Butyrivibrio proteoclasticus B316]